MAEHMSPAEIAALLKRVGKWREDLTRKQLMALEDAGLMSLRAWGQGLPDFDAIDPIDGEPVPQTMDEAFTLLRRLADRSNLSPMGVLHALTAGMLAGGLLADEFPALLTHRVEGKGIRPS